MISTPAFECRTSDQDWVPLVGVCDWQTALEHAGRVALESDGVEIRWLDYDDSTGRWIEMHRERVEAHVQMAAE